jgi:putative sigma-54 modulation protein
MQLNLTGKNIEITDAIQQLVDERFEALHQRYNIINNVHVVLHIDKHDHCAEATVHYQGSEIHATAKASIMYTAIDLLAEKLSGLMQKHKEKIIDSHRQAT